MTSIPGKIALITGAAGAIGESIAFACAAAGARIAIADRDSEALSRTAARLSEHGFPALQLDFDVTSAEQWKQAAEQVDRALGPVQLLFNNAGVSALGVAIEDIEAGYWDRVLSINLKGVVNGIQAVVPRLRAQGLDGHIVNTASIAGLGVTAPGGGAYMASKAALVALSEVLAQELRGTLIGVSVLCPGPVRSGLWRTSRSALSLPEIGTPPPASLAGSASPDAMNPDIVAGRVIEGVRAETFYIVTHPEFTPLIEARHARLLADIGV